MELGTTINRCADWICGDTPIARVLDNPFYTSIMLTLIILIIMVINSRNSSVIAFATYFYIFATISFTLFMYHRRFIKQTRNGVQGSAIARAMSHVSTIPLQSDVTIEPTSLNIMPGSPFRGRIDTI
jgi:hypothetical protein